MAITGRPTPAKLLGHALRIRCPRCGKAPLFKGWDLLVERCAECGLVLGAREPDTWFFMYMSTAGLTGFFLILLFLFPAPSNPFLARIFVTSVAVIAFVLSIPLRKSIALALEYYRDAGLENPRFSD